MSLNSQPSSINRLLRFTGEDPKGFDAGDYNLFRYCHNDPLDLTDPMGLEFNDSGMTVVEKPTVIDPYTGKRAFGHTEIALRAKVEAAAGKVTLKGYDVTVRKMEIATNSPYWPYGPRSSAQIRATKELHEPRHVEAARGEHDKYQKKMGQAIDRVRGNETPQSALNRVQEKLQKEFTRTVAPNETTGRWKQIRQMEGAQFSNLNFMQAVDAAQIENQQGEIPDFGMLGGGGLGLGGPPRSPRP